MGRRVVVGGVRRDGMEWDVVGLGVVGWDWDGAATPSLFLCLFVGSTKSHPIWQIVRSIPAAY